MKFKTFDSVANTACLDKYIEKFKWLFAKNENLIFENCKMIAANFEILERLDLSRLIERRKEVNLLEKTKAAIESARAALLDNFEIANLYFLEHTARRDKRNCGGLDNRILGLHCDFDARAKKSFELYHGVASRLLQFENTRLLTSVAYANHSGSSAAFGLLRREGITF